MRWGDKPDRTMSANEVLRRAREYPDRVYSDEEICKGLRDIITSAADSWLQEHGGHVGEIAEVRQLRGLEPNIRLRLSCTQCKERFELQVTK